MITALFLFALLTTPQDRIICDMWTRAITQDGMFAACGTLQLAGYQVRVYDLDMQLICQRDATYLNDIAALMTDCNIAEEKTLDEFVLRIVEPGVTELICTVISAQETQPTLEEVIAQCPQGAMRFQSGAYSIAWRAPYVPEEEARFTCPMRSLNIGTGLYEQVPSADYLMTDESLSWLAGKLIWNGRVDVSACGTSGLSPLTLAANPCGMTYAKSAVYGWQNQFNAEIYSAAVTYAVPAKLLKRMMSIESQFWPFYTAPAGETGLMQVTDNGLDTLLRFDPSIDPNYLGRDALNQLWSRAVTRSIFQCNFCSLQEAVDRIKNTMPYYARLLAAFHCRAVTINPALTGNDAWRQAVVDYNGSAEYLERIER